MNKSVTVIGIAAALLMAGCGVTSPTVRITEPHGIVAVQPFKTADRLYPVVVTEIDGITIASDGRNVYWLAPGKHRLKVLAAINDEPTLVRAWPNPDRTGYPAYEIEVDVEEGKRYIISAKLKGPTKIDWEPVISSVSDF